MQHPLAVNKAERVTASIIVPYIIFFENQER